jgi:hypothetical protein
LISEGAEGFLISTASRQAFVQWRVGILSPKQSDGGVKLTAFLHVVQLLKIVGAISPLSIGFYDLALN